MWNNTMSIIIIVIIVKIVLIFYCNNIVLFHTDAHSKTGVIVKSRTM